MENSYDLTPREFISRLHLLDVDYNLVSAYGHFGKKGLPWEKKGARWLEPVKKINRYRKVEREGNQYLLRIVGGVLWRMRQDMPDSHPRLFLRFYQ